MYCVLGSVMGQQLARREVEDGLRLYSLQRHDAAVKKWRRALRKLRSRKARFRTLTYLAHAHGERGKFRDMLAFAVQQIDVANDADDAAMRAEAYLNLARANERLCEFHKAVSYSRHSLQHQPQEPRIHGYVYLCQGNAYLGFSNFSRALENYEHALRIAKQASETALELQVYCSLGYLFTYLKDYEKGLAFQLKAADMAKSFKICDLSSKFQRLTSFNLVLPLRKLGRLRDAMDCCEDSLKMALAEGDRPIQAKCLCAFADLQRRSNDLQKAYPRYEGAFSLLMEIGDRLGQIEVLAGMAKTMATMKSLAKVCECQALEYNTKALDIAVAIGSKLHQYRCYRRMAALYHSLGDMERADECDTQWHRLQTDMDIICGVCSLPIADRPDMIEALPCYHLVHARCAARLKRSSGTNSLSVGIRPESSSENCPRCLTAPPKTPTMG